MNDDLPHHAKQFAYSEIPESEELNSRQYELQLYSIWVLVQLHMTEMKNYIKYQQLDFCETVFKNSQ